MPVQSGPHIVVLGAGYAGATAASVIERKMPQAKVTVIDRRKALVHKFAALRAAVRGSKYSHRVVVPNEKLVEKGKVLCAQIDKISENSVLLKNGETLNFDFLVCATGANNNFGEPQADLETLDAMKGYYNTIAEQVKKATKILIVGGGAVGVELAGEIKAEYKDKQLTLVESHDTLLYSDPPFKKKFRDKLERLLKNRDVKVIYGKRAQGLDMTKPFVAGQQTVTLESNEGSETVDTDLVLLTIGASVNSEFYPEEWVDETKRLKVQPSLQLEGKTKIFAVGDVNNVAEKKMGYLAQKQATLAVSNIIALAKNPEAKLKNYKPQHGIHIVPIGPTAGAAQAGPAVLGSFLTSNMKGKELFCSKTWKLCNQKAALQKETEAR